MIRNKKAISPIIATLLLISFVVAITVLVSNLLFLDEAAPEEIERCGGKDILRVISFSNNKDVCYTGVSIAGNIRLSLENRGDIPISKLGVTVFGTKTLQTTELRTLISPGTPFREDIAYDFLKNGNIEGIRITPFVSSGETEYQCQESNLEIKKDNIRAC